MASVPCASHLQLRSPSSCSAGLSGGLKSPFLVSARNLGWLGSSSLRAALRRCSSRRGGATCFFKFGKNGMDAEGAGIYGSQSRDDFDRDDVEQAIKVIDFGDSLSSKWVFVELGVASLSESVEKPLSYSSYFNYMGMLAVEGTYDKMDALLNQNIHPVDILLLMAATECDKPKIEELIRAGAKCDVKDCDGRTALDRAGSDEIRDLILSLSSLKV